MKRHWEPLSARATIELMAGLTRETELRLAPEVQMSLLGDQLWVGVGGGSVLVRAGLLPVIDLFRSPVRFDEVLERLPSGTALDWIELSADLVRLHEHGVLVSDAQRTRARPIGSTRMHIAMLDDEARTQAYLRAIAATVKPGDVVVEVGCGSGVLSVAAARAGARKVYAIERTAIADVAQRVFEVNGVADRVELVRGNSTEVELPESADVLLSEIVGHDPFAENVLDYTRDALKRLLSPDPRLVPGSLRVAVVPVALPEPLLACHTFVPTSAERWRAAYGIDFSPMASYRAPWPRMLLLSPSEAATLVPVGDRASLCEIDLHAPPPRIDERALLTLRRPGPFHAIMVLFEIHLGGGEVVVSDPWADERATSWKLPVWLLPQPVDAQPGREIGVTYEFTGVTPRLRLLESGD